MGFNPVVAVGDVGVTVNVGVGDFEVTVNVAVAMLPAASEAVTVYVPGDTDGTMKSPFIRENIPTPVMRNVF